MSTASGELVIQWRDGNQNAAATLFRRYAERLIALARSRLSARLKRHLDPEDVVQEAFVSFFHGARLGRYALERSGDLWRLLVVITLHKLQHEVERYSTGKRALGRECHLEAKRGRHKRQEQLLDREPTPVVAAALADLVNRLLSRLDPARRRMVELRLQGWHIRDIAAELTSNERTIRRRLEQIKQQLQRLCPGDQLPRP
jgi:RNA polymerase sigma-70 factor (ECF subfamily)